MTQAARVVGLMRQAGRVKTRDDLPTFRAPITKVYGVTGNDLSAVAVMDLGGREAIILASEGAVGQRLHMELRRRVLDAGYKLTQERLADVALIADINNAITKEDVDNKASDVRPIVEEMIRDAINEKATDIHLCCRENSGMVLFRIHSRIYQYHGFDVVTCEQVAGFMFTQMADSRTRSQGSFALEAKSMSCMIRATVNGTQYKLRYKFIRVADGWDVIIRILAVETPGQRNATFAELGYETSQIKQLELSVGRSIGLIAITGPTGSGKSTTLKTMMEFDPKRLSKKRYSVEDPVEYKIFGVSQISIQRNDHQDEESNNDDFIGVLRDILRGDPDDVMVGEIRDRITTQMVADFVLTGHKIYTTVHTSSAIEMVIRLFRLGLDRHVMAARRFISALAFQRLLPVLCENCKVPAKDVLPKEKLALLALKFRLNTNNIYCFSEAGCEHCHGRGITGSTVVAEIITPDKVIRQKIADGLDEEAEMYWRESRTTGFDDVDMTGKTAFEHALYKVSCGRIDPRDLEQEFEPLETYELVEVSI
ncbi:GspE/PulE family protein [Pseudomonas sp.]|uniref:GspE/PulE family protein n=1 Tax=Pseudomonas sp. TaxID=306 RepID=UPI003FD7C1DD